MAEFSRVVTPRRLILAGLALSAVLVVGAATASLMPGAPRAGAPVSPSPSSTAVGPIGPVIPSTDAAPNAAPAAPGPIGPRTTTEVQQGATPAAALPTSTPAGPLFSGPLPASATSTGALVAGFPSAIPLPKGNTISTSSVSSNGDRLQATLSAKTTIGSAELVDWYSAQFAKLSLPGSLAPATGGSTAFAFANGDDSITLTVTPSKSGGSRYTLFGTFAAVSG
jgi:hypothetical protein